MAENMQLIVITSCTSCRKGNNNYKVLKSDIAGKTQTQIVSLNQEEKTHGNSAIAFWKQNYTDAAFYRQRINEIK